MKGYNFANAFSKDQATTLKMSLPQKKRHLFLMTSEHLLSNQTNLLISKKQRNEKVD